MAGRDSTNQPPEWPTAASRGAERISAQLARSAAWAGATAAGRRPLVHVDAGARLMRRFEQAHGAGVWADRFAQRFVAGAFRMPHADLTLSRYLPVQRQFDVARRYGTPPTAPPPVAEVARVVEPAAPEIAIDAELLGDLASFRPMQPGGGAPPPSEPGPASSAPSGSPMAARQVSDLGAAQPRATVAMRSTPHAPPSAGPGSLSDSMLARTPDTPEDGDAAPTNDNAASEYPATTWPAAAPLQRVVGPPVLLPNPLRRMGLLPSAPDISRQPLLRSQEPGARSQEIGAQPLPLLRSQEPGARSQEIGTQLLPLLRSPEPGAPRPVIGAQLLQQTGTLPLARAAEAAPVRRTPDARGQVSRAQRSPQADVLPPARVADAAQPHHTPTLVSRLQPDAPSHPLGSTLLARAAEIPLTHHVPASATAQWPGVGGLPLTRTTEAALVRRAPAARSPEPGAQSLEPSGQSLTQTGMSPLADVAETTLVSRVPAFARGHELEGGSLPLAGTQPLARAAEATPGEQPTEATGTYLPLTAPALARTPEAVLVSRVTAARVPESGAGHAPLAGTLPLARTAAATLVGNAPTTVARLMRSLASGVGSVPQPSTGTLARAAETTPIARSEDGGRYPSAVGGLALSRAADIQPAARSAARTSGALGEPGRGAEAGSMPLVALRAAAQQVARPNPLRRMGLLPSAQDISRSVLPAALPYAAPAESVAASASLAEATAAPAESTAVGTDALARAADAMLPETGAQQPAAGADDMPAAPFGFQRMGLAQGAAFSQTISSGAAQLARLADQPTMTVAARRAAQGAGEGPAPTTLPLWRVAQDGSGTAASQRGATTSAGLAPLARRADASAGASGMPLLRLADSQPAASVTPSSGTAQRQPQSSGGAASLMPPARFTAGLPVMRSALIAGGAELSGTAQRQPQSSGGAASLMPLARFADALPVMRSALIAGGAELSGTAQRQPQSSGGAASQMPPARFADALPVMRSALITEGAEFGAIGATTRQPLPVSHPAGGAALDSPAIIGQSLVSRYAASSLPQTPDRAASVPSAGDAGSATAALPLAVYAPAAGQGSGVMRRWGPFAGLEQMKQPLAALGGGSRALGGAAGLADTIGGRLGALGGEATGTLAGLADNPAAAIGGALELARPSASAGGPTSALAELADNPAAAIDGALELARPGGMSQLTSGLAAAAPSLDLALPQRSAGSATAASASDELGSIMQGSAASSAAAPPAASAEPDIATLAQKVYDYLRRNARIEQERLGRW